MNANNSFDFLRRPKVFPVRFIFVYVFGIMNNSRFSDRRQNISLTHKQRRFNMKISQGIKHFFNYQRMNVKKKYVAEL